jgi:hypothetical protein
LAAPKAGKPFFLWHNATRMHVYTHLSPEYAGKTGFGLYADGMAELDWEVGQILKKVDELGIADNTIVMFTSDNGAEVFTWPDGGNHPFRGEKGTTETLRAYNEMIKARRLRLDAVHTGLPGVMWTVIIMGAFIGLSSSFFFRVEDARLQGTQVLLLAVFIGLIIFMILALDRPFRGDLGISADPYRLIYEQLMKP